MTDTNEALENATNNYDTKDTKLRRVRELWTKTIRYSAYQTDETVSEMDELLREDEG